MVSRAVLREERQEIAPVRDLFARVPSVPGAWVDRPRLSARLDVATERTLTLVVAPAGAGKTVTMARWAREHHRGAVRWLNARQGLDLCALGWELVRAGGGSAEVVRPQGTVQTQIAGICAALEALRPREIVVVDDAHEMPHNCFLLLAEALNRCPDSVHVVLVSRWDPPLPLLMLEAQGRATVIRGHQLRMSPAEAHSLVMLHSGGPKSRHVEAIVRYARGWAAVLVLAGRYLRSFPQSVPVTLDEVAADGRGLADALASEVFSSLGEQQRHVLLCVAGEPTVASAVAARLSGDIHAGQVLEELERVGLLVERHPPPADALPGEVHFRLHPMLLEVLRRRLAAGGVEVMRARAVVLKTAALDGAHGEAGDAMRRMLWVRAFDEAADLVAEQGLNLVVSGQAELVSRLAALAPAVIAQRPGTWPAMSVTRRWEGAVVGAAYWAQRSQEHLLAADVRQPGEDLDLALVRLLRAATGEYDMTRAVDDACRLLADWPVALSLPRRALLLVELGAGETWLGRLDSAAEHLASASAICRAADFRSLLPDALSRLAVAELLRARTEAALEAAAAAAEPSSAGRGLAEECRERVAVVADVAARQTIAHAAELRTLGSDLVAAQDPGHRSRSQPTCPRDPATAVLWLLATARAAAANGRDGRAVLAATPQLRVDLSDYMAMVLDLERCGYAVAAGDREDLRAIAGRLAALGATAESACVEAVLADMDANLTGADELFSQVISGRLEPLVPVLRPHALMCAAQIADSRGQRRRADALMVDALRATALERYAVPFLGWSFCGTPVPVLLSRVQSIEDSPWRQELYARVSVLEPVAKPKYAHTPLLFEETPAVAVTQAAIPPLTRRESDVLFALAHGSSYADIAAALVITENTVKTHVSSLYAKLGVTRRSHALHVARAAGLI